MANHPITMNKLRQILRYYTEGKSKSEITRLTGSSRNTIKRYLKIFIREQLSYSDVEQMNNHRLSELFCVQEDRKPPEKLRQLHALLPEIEKALRRKGNTRTRLWKQLYLVKHPDGFRFTQFSRYLNRYLMRLQPVMHIEHKAGDKMYVDFAGEKLLVTDHQSGEVKEAEVFIAILGCSQLTYVEAVATQNKHDFIRGCENALHYFGGTPAAIVPDNLKSAVTKSSRYEPTLNETFEDFALHYSCAVLPARVYRPRDKSLVEGAVKIAYQRIYTSLHDHTFFSLQDLNTAIRNALDEHNNAIMQGRNYSRRQQFEEVERNTLKPLPQYRYSFRHVRQATVMRNGHVCLSPDKHYYSVPFHFIGKKVKLIYNDAQVDLYHHYECIATHERNYKSNAYTTCADHLASTHRFLLEVSTEKFIEQGNQIDKEVGNYLHEVIGTKQHPEQAYKSCQGILMLAKKLGNDRLIKACRRAGSFGLYSYAAVLNILERGLDRMEEEPQQTQVNTPLHQNIRGREYYQ